MCDTLLDLSTYKLRYTMYQIKSKIALTALNRIKENQHLTIVLRNRAENRLAAGWLNLGDIPQD